MSHAGDGAMGAEVAGAPVVAAVNAPSPADARAADAGAGDGAIVLARHGRPGLDRSRAISWRAFRDWWAAYDAGGLAADQTPDPRLVAVAREADVIFASPLRRSQETAAAAAAGRTVLTDAVFAEARLPPPPLVGVRLRPGAWGVVARITWWMGLSGGEESRREAEARADLAAAHVIAAAHGGRTVLVCGHGWFNRMMRPALLARGWCCVRDGGDGYWSFRRYERLA